MSKIKSIVGTPQWYSETAKLYPNQMPQGIILAGLGLGNAQKGVFDQMKKFMSKEASNDETLTTSNPNTAAYKDARNAIFNELKGDERFKSFWEVPANKLPAVDAEAWHMAALLGIWKEATKGGRSRTKQESGESTHSTPTPISTTTSQSDTKQPRRASAGSAVSADTIGTRDLNKLSIGQQVAPTTGRSFGEIRLNFYTIGKGAEKLFSARMSSFIRSDHEDMMALREDGEIGPYSVEIAKLRHVISENAKALDYGTEDFSIFWPSSSGPLKLGSDGVFQTEVQLLVDSGRAEWNVVLAVPGTKRTDDDLGDLCDILRNKERREKASPLPLPPLRQPGGEATGRSNGGKGEAVQPTQASRDNSKGDNDILVLGEGIIPKPMTPVPLPSSSAPVISPTGISGPGSKDAGGGKHDGESFDPRLTVPEDLSDDDKESLDSFEDNDDFAGVIADTDADKAEMEEIERIQLANRVLNEELEQSRARMTPESFRNAADMFMLDYHLLCTTHDRIPFPRQWKLAEGAGLFPHQWQSLGEQLRQNEAFGGGGDGSGPGTGKSHPNAVQPIVLYWITRLKKLVQRSRRRTSDSKPKSEDNGVHLPKGTNGRCPSQDRWPLPCPCSKDNWTNQYIMPSGCTILAIVPNTGGDWANCLLDLFYRAPILALEFMPFRLAIDHEPTYKVMTRKLEIRYAKEVRVAKLDTEAKWRAAFSSEPPENAYPVIKAVKPTTFASLKSHEWAWTSVSIWGEEKGEEDDDEDPRKADDYDEYMKRYRAQVAKDGQSVVTQSGLPLKDIPSDATPVSASYLAHSIMTVVTPLTLGTRTKRTIAQVSLRRKSGRNNYTQDVRLGEDKLVDIALYIWDEAHNFVSTTSQAFSSLRSLQVLKARRAQGWYAWYWLLSGTIRENGPNIIANHFSHFLSTPEWAPNYKGEFSHDKTQEKHDSVLQYLSYQHDTATKPRPDKHGKDQRIRPYEQFVRNYERIRMGNTEAAKRAQSSGAVYDLAADPEFQSYMSIMAEIIQTLVIERDDKTKRLDGKPLLATANIELDEQDVAISYDKIGRQHIKQFSREVNNEKKEKERRREDGADRRMGPSQASLAHLKSYHALCVASSAPCLNDFCRKHDIDTHANSLKEIYSTVRQSSLWTEFDEAVKHDKKWAWILQYVQNAEKSRKSGNSADDDGTLRKHKVLIGAKMPVIALLYAVGLARHLGATLKEYKDVETLANSSEPVALIHSGMSFPDRRMYVDIFNDIGHPLRILVTNVELFAEGVSLVAANHVIVESPLPRLEKYEQFKRRPIRFGQKEERVSVRLLYNVNSRVDSRIMEKRNFSKVSNSKLAKTKAIEVEDGGDGIGAADNPVEV